MRTKRFSEEQIIGVLKEAEAGAKTKDLCRRHGISEATFYNWKAKYAGMTVSEARRLKELEQENAKLQAAAGGRRARQGGIEGSARPKMVSPQAKRAAVVVLMTERDFGVTRACGLVGISRSLYRYRSVRPDSATLRARIEEIAAAKRRYGYRRVYVRLRARGLAGQPQACLPAVSRSWAWRCGGASASGSVRSSASPLPKPTAANDSWSMDFVSGRTVGGRRLRCLTIVDDCTRECLAIEVDTSITGRGSRRSWSGWPRRVVCRNRSRSTMVRSSTARCSTPGLTQPTCSSSFIRPGKPNENAYIESFNGKFRDECLNEHWFVSDRTRARSHRSVADRIQHRAHAQLARQPHARGVRRGPGHEADRSGIFNRRL